MSGEAAERSEVGEGAAFCASAFFSVIPTGAEGPRIFFLTLATRAHGRPAEGARLLRWSGASNGIASHRIG